MAASTAAISAGASLVCKLRVVQSRRFGKKNVGQHTATIALHEEILSMVTFFEPLVLFGKGFVHTLTLTLVMQGRSKIHRITAPESFLPVLHNDVL